MKRSVFIFVILIGLGAAVGWRIGILGISKSAEQATYLATENRGLRARLNDLENIPDVKRGPRFSYIIARVFSVYPLNNRSLLTINAGEADGVALGMAVTIGGHTALGKVIKTANHYSIVRTLFDPGWSLPVAIGEKKIDGLLVGGHDPEITMIEKKNNIFPSQMVYSAGTDFPYGLEIGLIGEVTEDPAAVLKSASITFDYILGGTAEVYIISDFLSP